MPIPLLSKTVSRFITYILIVGFSFYSGISLYSLYGTRSLAKISLATLKEFGPQIDKATQGDMRIQAEKEVLIVKNSELKKWVEPYIRDYSGEQDFRISSAKVAEYLKSIAPRFDIKPTNAKLAFKDGKAEVFVPHITGRELDIPMSMSLIISTMMSGNSSVSLTFEDVEPTITLDKINDLGIKTLIGRGESDYGKSSAARISNIKVGLNKFNGIILKPGEEFSFNKFLGDVDDQNGYQAELVIKSGKLVKEFGGGLCQVATTMFRAAILSGLPILERKPHSFAVHYYNPQGFDATIYPGTVDLRFSNNTQNHILIQAKLVGSRLSVEIYGSDDGRKVTMDGPYMYDKKANGALKAYFTRTISYPNNPGQVERFNSVYNPPPKSPLERNPLE